MSLGITDKKKIAVFRKCVQILTASKEDFHIHFTKTHVRLFNMFQDETTYMIDFQAPWFRSFKAPDCVNQQKIETLQIRCGRDIFLQSFNIIDDSEVEVKVVIENELRGHLQVMKTRDLFRVEARVPFEVETDLICEDNYEFPDNQLLVNAEINHMKNIRGIFKKSAKTEVMGLIFTDDMLTFNGQVNNKFKYEIKASTLVNFGNYLSGSFDQVSTYQISLPLKHLLNLIKVCDHIDGNFMTAMEQTDGDACVCFLFTNSPSRDFKFCVGIGNCKFQPLDQDINLKKGALQRIVKQENYKSKQPVIRADYDMPTNQISNLNIKCEEGGTHNTFSNLNLHQGYSQDEPDVGQINTMVPRKKGIRQAKQLIDEDQEPSIFKQEREMSVGEEDQQDRSMDIKLEPVDGERHHRDRKTRDQRYDDDEEDEDSDQEEESDIQARKREFYQEVDKEEFF